MTYQTPNVSTPLKDEWLKAANDVPETLHQSALGSAWNDGDVHGTEAPPALNMNISEHISLERQIHAVAALYEKGEFERADILLDKIIERCEATGELDALYTVMENAGITPPAPSPEEEKPDLLHNPYIMPLGL